MHASIKFRFSVCVSVNVCNFADANSTEFNPETKFPVIALMDSQLNVTDKGGTMRLGAYPCKVTPDTFTANAYFGDARELHEIQERHRHRFEFNNNFRDTFQKNGMVIAGVSPDENLVEVIELDKSLHPYFVGCQFHPELKSRPNHPHPLFREFVTAAINNS